MISGKELFDKIKNKNFKENILEKIEEFEIIEKKYIWDRVYDNTSAFILNKYGETEKSKARSEFAEDCLKKNNNICINKEDADYEIIKRQYEYQLRKATTVAWAEYYEDIDWDNENQEKNAIEYNHNAKEIVTRHTYTMQYYPEYFYFPAGSYADKFIEENKNLIRKLYKVKEEK